MQSSLIDKNTFLSFLSKKSENETSRLVWGILTYITLVYIHFGLAIAGFLPLWTFCIAVPMYIARWMIGLHEALHAIKLEDTNSLIMLHLLLVTPLSLGYREIRDIHMRHHAYTLTDKDPDIYHLRGNMLSGFILATFSPEISAYNWIRNKGVDKALLFGMLLRFVLFCIFVGSLGWLSLWYFIPVRIAYGTCMFAISFPLHRKNGAYGTFTPNFGILLETIMELYAGSTALNTLKYHDIHHDYPRISAQKLPVARHHYKPKRSSLAVDSAKTPLD